MSKSNEEVEIAEAVLIFKAAWEAADHEGRQGNRVEAGIRALVDAGWMKHDGTVWVP